MSTPSTSPVERQPRRQVPHIQADHIEFGSHVVLPNVGEIPYAKHALTGAVNQRDWQEGLQPILTDPLRNGLLTNSGCKPERSESFEGYARETRATWGVACGPPMVVFETERSKKNGVEQRGGPTHAVASKKPRGNIASGLSVNQLWLKS
jgi:hypothetical protein